MAHITAERDNQKSEEKSYKTYVIVTPFFIFPLSSNGSG